MIKEEKMMKRSPFGTIRKRLSDITNLHSQHHRSPVKDKENFPTFDGSSTKNYIEQLLQENAMMMKIIQERDKFIEATGIEMQKLRLIVQKVQLQNQHLAQSNSQMLAELNVSKDRLKAVRHELACKDALLKQKVVELEEKAKMQCQTNGLQEKDTTTENKAADHPLQANNNTDYKEAKNKKRPTRSQSMGSTLSQQAADKEMAENKRRCLRRQSVRLKSHQKPHVDLFEIDVADFPVSHQPMNEPLCKSKSIMAGDEEESTQPSSNASKAQRSSLGKALPRASGKVQSYNEPLHNVANCPISHQPMDEPLPKSKPCMVGDKEEGKRSSNASELHRLSLGRPLRRAAGKVQSYKEPPLNVKIRRPE